MSSGCDVQPSFIDLEYPFFTLAEEIVVGVVSLFAATRAVVRNKWT